MLLVSDATIRRVLEHVVIWSSVVAFLVTMLFVTILLKRKLTYERLIRAGLPTIYWYPKWINLSSSRLDKESTTVRSKLSLDNTIGEDLSYNILSSSNITNILPRMLRLRGPYDMYGTVYGAATSVVHVAHPIPAHTILCGSGNITQKAPAYNHFKNFCGNGVFTADGEEWKSKRAAVLHALLMRQRTIVSSEEDTTMSSAKSQPAEKSFYSRIEHEANHAVAKLIEALDQEMHALKQEHKKSIYHTNMVPILQRATIGLIYRYITHNDLMEDEKCTTETQYEEKQTQDVANSFPDMKAQRFIQKYLQSITRIRMILLAQSRSIWFVLPRWFYRTFAMLYQEEENTMQSIRQMAILACQSAELSSPLGQLQNHPIYSSSRNRDGIEMIANDAPETSNYFSKNLIDEAITLLFAGQDTSAATLSWTLHLLTLYPNIQKTLFAEIQSVLKDEPYHGDINITRKHIARMPYLDAIIKESMRLFPVAPFIVRKLTQEVDISTANQVKGHIQLPSNSIACIWIFSLHRHPDFWDRPNDFLPERWLVSPTNECLDGKMPTASSRDLGITTPGAYIPYAIGARNCLGQPLANIVLRIILARLVHRFEFQDDRVTALSLKQTALGEPLAPKLVDRLRKDMQAGFTVLPHGGLTLSIRHRN